MRGLLYEHTCSTWSPSGSQLVPPCFPTWSHSTPSPPHPCALQVAVKVLPWGPNEVSSELKRELKLLQRCSSPDIVRAYGAFAQPKELWIVMEYYLPIAPQPISSNRIPSHPVPSHPISSHPNLSHPIPSHPIPSHPIPQPILYHPVTTYQSIQSQTTSWNAIQC